jgi:hypothetical protein
LGFGPPLPPSGVHTVTRQFDDCLAAMAGWDGKG